MGAFQNIGMDGYLKRYGLKNGLKRGLFMANPIHKVQDYENKKILYYHKAMKYLKKHYTQFTQEGVEKIEYGICEIENPVWIYWKQGIHNAPEIVQRCIASVEAYSTRPVIKLDENSTKNYVQLPEDIINKYKMGRMSDAALSDLIRFSLLEHFGGTWIDATVLLTGELPEYIIESDFFAFQDTFGLVENPALISNWLLHSKPHNNIIKETQNMAFAYWRKEKYVIDYLFTYMFLEIAYERNKNNCGWFPYANSDYCHQYLNALDEEYSEKKLNHIKELSSIHKLTYKLKDEIFEKKNTFYAKLMEG